MRIRTMRRRGAEFRAENRERVAKGQIKDGIAKRKGNGWLTDR